MNQATVNILEHSWAFFVSYYFADNKITGKLETEYVTIKLERSKFLHLDMD
jgi:hypothetical protein